MADQRTDISLKKASAAMKAEELATANRAIYLMSLTERISWNAALSAAVSRLLKDGAPADCVAKVKALMR